MMTLIMTLSTLAGCLDTGTDIEEELDELGIESLPKQSIGVSMPTIDGIMKKPLGSFGFDEWADSYTFPSGDYSFTGSHNGKVNDSSIGFHMKAIGDDVAVALEIPLITGTNASVASVSSKFYYFDGSGSIPAESYRSATVGVAESPWQMELITPCEHIDCIDEEISLIQRSNFEAMPTFTLGDEEEDSSSDYTGIFDLIPVVMVDFEHLLAAKQSTTLLTIETLKYDALEYSRSLSAVLITITFEDGDEIEVWKWENMYFGYANPSSKQTDVGITGVELIQVIQTEDMDMPLLKNKPTLARVYVTSDIDMLDVEVNFQMCILILCTTPMTKELAAPSVVDREDFGKSANFVIPQDWLQYDIISIVASVTIPYVTEISDTDSSNDVWAENFELTETKDFTAGYIRIGQDAGWSSDLDQIDEARAIKTMTYSLDLFPVNDYEIQSWSWNNADDEMYDATGMSNQEVVGSLSVAFDNYRAQLLVEWIDSECAYDPTCPLPEIPDQLVGLFPYSGQQSAWDDGSITSGGISDPGWLDGSSFVSTCSYWSSSSVLCPAHEMNHNLGPAEPGYDDHGEWGEHLSKTGEGTDADCSTSGQDSDWISEYGSAGKPFNIKDLGWNSKDDNPETDQTALIPSSYPDLMTYCRATTNASKVNHYLVPYRADDDQIVKWMSTYRYELLYDYLESHETWFPTEPYGRAPLNQDDYTIRIVNLKYDDDYKILKFDSELTTGILDSAFGTEIEDEKGILTAVAVDSDGNVIAQRAIYPAFLDSHGGDSDTSSHTVRFQDNGNIDTVYIVDKDENVIDSIGSSKDLSSFSEAKVELNSESYAREDSIYAEWEDGNFRDVRYKVEYSKGDGIWYPLSNWITETKSLDHIGTLPASDSALIRVQINNGFDSAFMYSAPFTVANQAPVLYVDIRAADKTINSALPNPKLIDTSMAYDEKSAGEVLAKAMEMPNIEISQHQSITITPNINDMDWEVTNDAGCEVSLEYNGRIVWTTNSREKLDLNNNIVRSTPSSTELFASSKQPPCSSKNGEFSPISFPNPDFPPHMMMPGGYSLKITYEDAQGAEATPVVVNFNVIEHRPYAESDLEEFQEKLVIVHPQFEGGDIGRLCQLWSTADWARDAEKTEGISPEDYKAIAETDMATICALEREVINPTGVPAPDKEEIVEK